MISQRLCSNIPDTLLLLFSHRPPSLLSPAPHLPTRALLSESKGPPSAFSFFSHTQNKGKRPSDPGVHWSERDRSCLLKRSLSIAACRLAIGTNEAYHSLILIPFDLTHFIDSPCAPNEMLNLSPVAAVPCSYCYGDRERGEGSAGEIPQHGRCSIKKAHSSIPLSRTLPLSLLHLSISCSKLKVTLKNSWKTQKCHFWKCVRQYLTVSGYYMAWWALLRGTIRKDWNILSG